MTFPAQIDIEIADGEHAAAYHLARGKRDFRAARTRAIVLCAFAFILLCAVIQQILTTAVASTGSPSFGDVVWSNVNLRNVGLLGGVIAILVVWAIYGLTSLKVTARKESAHLKKVVTDGTLVIGNEGFLYRRGDGDEFRDKFKELYECFEDKDLFVLITKEQRWVILPKRLMSREQMGELSKILTLDMKKYFFKDGQPNVDVEMKYMFFPTKRHREE